MNIIKFISSRQSWSIPYAIFAAIFVVLPLLLIVVFAFTDENGALTLYNFQKFLAHPEAINTFVYSIGIAFLNTLQKMDRSYIEAAEDLGASPWQQFFKVILPLSMPGVASGILMVFMPTISTFAISELLTMNNIKLFGTTIQENINNSMWNYGAALSLIMLFLIGASTLIAGDDSKQKGGIR